MWSAVNVTFTHPGKISGIFCKSTLALIDLLSQLGPMSDIILSGSTWLLILTSRSGNYFDLLWFFIVPLMVVSDIFERQCGSGSTPCNLCSNRLTGELKLCELPWVVVQRLCSAAITISHVVLLQRKSIAYQQWVIHSRKVAHIHCWGIIGVRLNQATCKYCFMNILCSFFIIRDVKGDNYMNFIAQGRLQVIFLFQEQDYMKRILIIKRNVTLLIEL